MKKVLLLTLVIVGIPFFVINFFVKDDEISPRMAKKKARALSKGKMGKIFRYKLAYLPQMALVVVTVLIYGGVYFAQLYTYAYFDAVDELVKIHNTELEI